MSEQSARTVFAQALLADVAPDEAELFESYEAAALGTSRDGHAGTGMGLPPEIAGAIGMVAVLVGHSVFNKLLEWAAGVGTDIIKKVVVDASADKLKSWLKWPNKANLAGVLTAKGRLEILAIVENEAVGAKISREETEKLLKSTASRLGL